RFPLTISGGPLRRLLGLNRAYHPGLKLGAEGTEGLVGFPVFRRRVGEGLELGLLFRGQGAGRQAVPAFVEAGLLGLGLASCQISQLAQESIAHFSLPSCSVLRVEAQGPDNSSRSLRARRRRRLCQA